MALAAHKRLEATALRLIKRHGRQVTLVRRDESPENPDKPWEGSLPGSSTKVTVTAAFAEPSSHEDAELLRQASEVALVAGSAQGAHDFRTFSAVEDGTTPRKVVRVRRTQPADTPILFEFFLEGA